MRGWNEYYPEGDAIQEACMTRLQGYYDRDFSQEVRLLACSCMTEFRWWLVLLCKICIAAILISYTYKLPMRLIAFLAERWHASVELKHIASALCDDRTISCVKTW